MGDAWAYGLKRGMLEAVMRLMVMMTVRLMRLVILMMAGADDVGHGGW